MIRASRAVKNASQILNTNQCVCQMTQTTRSYAKGKKKEGEIDLGKESMIEAAKDYLRKTNPTITKKTAQEYKKDAMLANQFSFQWLLKKQRFSVLFEKKRALKEKALKALPAELRKEAVKNDYSAWPSLLQPVDYVLPAQEGFRLPEEPARNEL